PLLSGHPKGSSWLSWPKERRTPESWLERARSRSDGCKRPSAAWKSRGKSSAATGAATASSCGVHGAQAPCGPEICCVTIVGKLREGAASSLPSCLQQGDE